MKRRGRSQRDAQPSCRFWRRPHGLAVPVLAALACVGKPTENGVRAPGAAPAGEPSGAPVDPAGPPPPPAFEALGPAAFAAKVKDSLTGLPLDDGELQAVGDDLRPLIDGWMAQPQFREKMFDFWKSAFQQTQLDPTDLDDQLRLDSANVSRADQRRMLTCVEESFPRTVQQLVDEGRPFTETVTTTRFMLNLPLMVALAYMDAAPRNDTGRAVAAGFWLMNKFGGPMFRYQQVTNADPVTGVVTPIPFEETINPVHPNFMKWTFTQPDPARYPPCPEPVVAMGTRAIERTFGAIFGSRDACQGAGNAPSQFSEADWTTWRMIDVRAPKPGEERTMFWDLPHLRDPATTEIVLGMPRVGFMTTLAFFANWATNPSNSYRVTTNQALIVALGRSFDDRSTTVQVSETSVDAQHIQPGSVCFGCHQTLDPMRDFFKQSYSLTYFQQLDAGNKRNPLPAQATFTVDGSPPLVGNGVPALAQGIARHPRFAVAWAQKLCHFANASDCHDDDPELLRVAQLFRASGHDWKTLVRELYASPLVTYRSPTKTALADGVVIGIARREALCARLSNRLAIKDACNLRGESPLVRAAATSASNLSAGVAGSSYARADVQPVMPHDPNLFFASATEKLCSLLAAQLVDAATGPWKSAARDPAIADFVHVLMGVPGRDPREAALRAILGKHHAAALAAKERPADALRSTFVLACSSPLAVSSGL